jgi:hypothetical protein
VLGLESVLLLILSEEVENSLVSLVPGHMVVGVLVSMAESAHGETHGLYPDLG